MIHVRMLASSMCMKTKKYVERPSDDEKAKKLAINLIVKACIYLFKVSLQKKKNIYVFLLLGNEYEHKN
jgi:hypothetical protein